MKNLIFMMFLMVGLVQNVNAQGWYGSSNSNSGYTRSQAQSASITISNRSEYTLTVKILKTGGRGVYRTVRISPKSYSTVTFSSSDSYYTKTKAVKSGLFGDETLYRKGGVFSVQCDNQGYTEGTLEFYVSSGRGSSGQGISKAEFENDK